VRGRIALRASSTSTKRRASMPAATANSIPIASLLMATSWPATDGAWKRSATPGHTANHMAFALKDSEIIFSGDHVMAWSTPVVAPPDGAMSDYMASLEKLLHRPETIYFPGHGGAVRDAPRFVEPTSATVAAASNQS
jgi:glyoxylase-like metal-dependent hydrolase (beta-lactamase superfamily II)